MEKRVSKIEALPRLASEFRVAAYARVSSEKDSMRHSLSAQVSYYSNFIQSHPGWYYAGVYADEPISGTKDGRAEFQRMLRDCRTGKTHMIITKSISRFARNTVILLETVRELKELGIDVFFEEQNIHSKSADGELMLTILASYAQEESRSVSENMKWRIRKAYEKGETMCWNFMFGYRISKEKGIGIDPVEGPIAQEAFRLVAAGQSLNSVARWLNQGGHFGALGGKWKTPRLRDMLANEKYAGNALLQKTFINNHIEKKKLPNQGEIAQFYDLSVYLYTEFEVIVYKYTFTGPKRVQIHVYQSNRVQIHALKWGRKQKTDHTHFPRKAPDGRKAFISGHF